MISKRMATSVMRSPPPWEALEAVSNHLDPKSLAVASCVSKEWSSTMSADHRWEPLCEESFPSIVSALRSCFPAASYQQLYGIGLTASKRRPESPPPPRISLSDLVFVIEVRTKNGAVLALTETAEKFAENLAFMFEIEVDGEKFGAVAGPGAENVKVTWNVVLGPGMRAAFMMMESEGKADGWFTGELPAARCGGDGGSGSGLVADVKLGEKMRFGMMNQASLRYVGVDDALRYLQHFLLPSSNGCCE